MFSRIIMQEGFTMKKAFAPLFMLMLATVVLSQSQPENLSTTWSHYSTAAPAGFPQIGPIREGIFVSVWVSDPTITALRITLTYRDVYGRVLPATELMDRWSPYRANNTACVLWVGNVKVLSISVVPLKAADVTKFAEINES